MFPPIGTTISVYRNDIRFEGEIVFISPCGQLAVMFDEFLNESIVVRPNDKFEVR